jgi:hypothetical protein
MTRWRGAVLTLLVGCAPTDKGREHAPPMDVRAEAGAGGDASMDATSESTSCEHASEAIRAGRLVGWRGLPAGCSPQALFGVAFDDGWGARKLGSQFEPARMRLLELTGFYRPLVTVRDGTVVMFDATNPVLDGGWGALAADLGAPEASRDFVYSSVTMTGGERIHARRGITVFLNPENDVVLHVALYEPTTVDGYEQRLRPSLDKKPLPAK